MKPLIIVHGGAGRVPEEGWAERREGCREAALAGWECLVRGGSALDAVEEAVAFLEDHPLFNAGRGSRSGLPQHDHWDPWNRRPRPEVRKCKER